MCAVEICSEKNKKGYEFKLEMAEKNMQKKKKKAYISDLVRV